ncbi:hypothetical protein AB0H83_34875 [Dactylosporangium sp. NPDC050688]|uniref:hypothetical protein n=1 Tax=Dactylosporangium sp. NPDC050688 TaxID=3157217 RepID=UPI0033EE183D
MPQLYGRRSHRHERRIFAANDGHSRSRSVVAVEPGCFATEWGTTLTESEQLDTYRDVTTPMLAGSRAMKQLPMTNPPALFAAEVLRLIASDDRPTRLPIGEDAWQALLDAAHRQHTALLNARPLAVS